MDAKTEALHQTHSHIHLFLRSHNLPKTASALSKELLKNGTPLITDQLDPRPSEGALLALLKAKVDLNRAKRSSKEKETKKAADVLSDSDDSADSADSSDDEQEATKGAPKAKDTKTAVNKAESSDSDSDSDSSSDSDAASDSDSNSSDDEEEEEEKPTSLVGKVVDKVKMVAKAVAEEIAVLEKPSTSAKKLETASDSDDSSDDSSDEEDKEKKVPVKATATKVVEAVAPKATSNKRKAGESSSDSDSGSDSSSFDSDSSSSSSSDSDSDSSSDSDAESKAKPTKKKQKVVASPKAPEPVSLPPPVPAVASPKLTTPLANGINGGNKKKERVVNAPFRRVKAEEPAGMSDYGAKASADLLVTRGKGFTKEKNKKKRGSYRGGDITMESHSIKFNYD
ncbi:BZ3500_MvSof-1268-A1-R1_Chr4-2g06947 [Microbotryum saponariae]|uniref:BZ3500_MvSof-1268-A1-R1_Chr4-2g06947 protein n=2 Tax=Microbotryum TaxID=34416 RepID=A0A2X0NG07_9BASI|nr:BZ3500_MvSof-1268-A1-R1_Chr4-2g06947 [Microbotryum saponariae]SDA06612.1 BZ3501_MvSof-1269-A2-R1_Chr4-2g06658 [Microbotryum saponariae]